MVYSNSQLRVKGLDIHIPLLQRKKNSSGLQFKVAYWPALAVGGAAQLVATHCQNEQTLEPRSATSQTNLCPRQPDYGFRPTTLTILVASITRY